jgi:hypothetical protein
LNHSTIGKIPVRNRSALMQINPLVLLLCAAAAL